MENISRLKNQLSKMKLPLTIQYELTSACNMSCPYCYNDSGIIKEKDLNQDEWLSITNRLVAEGGVFQVIFSGGEPLLRKQDILKMLEIFDKDGTVFSLITNGVLLDEQLIKKLSSYTWLEIQISIDFPDNRHDLVRNYKGAFSIIDKNLEILYKYKIPFRIATVVTKNNLSILNEMIDYALHKKANEIIFSEVFTSGRACFNDLLLTPKERIFFRNNILKYQDEYKERIIITKGLSEKEQLNLYKDQVPLGVIVRPNGNIKLDCLLPFAIGNVKSLISWEKMWERCYDDNIQDKVNNYINLITNDKDRKIRNNIDEDVKLY